MSDSPPSGTHAQSQADPAGSGDVGHTDAVGVPPSVSVRTVVAPAVAMAVLLGLVVAILLVVPRSSGVIGTVLALAVTACLVVLFLAVARAKGAVRAIHQRFNELTRVANETDAHARRFYQQVAHLQYALDTVRPWREDFCDHVERFASRIRNGERPAPCDLTGEPADARDPLAALARDQRLIQHAVELAMLRVADPVTVSDPAQLLRVFAKFGRRQQSLVHRAIRMLDELESEVEEPDLLKGLYRVDHLVTGMRRQAENLVVLGGAKAPRQWNKPLSMVAVMRSAVAEVELFNRVKLVLPIKGTLRGHAVTEIIHLLAELIENATVFSAPETVVMLRAQNVKAGLAIEVEDRGLGIGPDELDRLNGVLAGSDATDIGELLSDGLIGLWVVAQLARRNDVKVRLRTNIFGGISADVVVPSSLLGGESDNGSTQSAQRELVPAGVTAAPQPSAARPVPAAVYRGPHDDPNQYRWPDTMDEPPRPTWFTESDQRAGDQQRPVLPKRDPGTSHLAPELRDLPQATAPVASHTPGLMANFQRGFQAASQGDGEPVDSTDALADAPSQGEIH